MTQRLAVNAMLLTIMVIAFTLAVSVLVTPDAHAGGWCC